MFSVGLLQHQSDDDLQFDELADAEITAQNCSQDDDVWSIWDDASGEIVAIIYQEILYRP